MSYAAEPRLDPRHWGNDLDASFGTEASGLTVMPVVLVVPCAEAA
jgi:hypothetical protein